MKKTIALLFILVFFAACNNKDSVLMPTENQNIEFSKLSTEQINENNDQQLSNEIKKALQNHEAITDVRAVNYGKMLIVAIKTKQHERFFLDSLKKELEEKITKHYDDIDLTFSVDKKILIELIALEKDLKNHQLQDDELKKRLKKISELAKEKS